MLICPNMLGVAGLCRYKRLFGNCRTCRSVLEGLSRQRLPCGASPSWTQVRAHGRLSDQWWCRMQGDGNVSFPDCCRRTQPIQHQPWYELWNLHRCLEWFLHLVHKLHFTDSGWASQQAIESGVEVLAANQVWHFPNGNVSAVGQHSQAVRSQLYLSDRKRARTLLWSPKPFPWHLLV